MVAGIADWTPGIFIPRTRSIGGIQADVTITETHTDQMTITRHPVEQGAPIADHAFKEPASVTVRAGWSASKTPDLSAETGVYGLLLSWQAAAIPFDVYTGKRVYHDMLIERLGVVTDESTEYALMADMNLQQVIIVSTQSGQVTGSSADASNHADPSSTAPESDTGTVSADPTVGGVEGTARGIRELNTAAPDINLLGGAF